MVKKKSFPHCDISTGKIYGCEKGSLEWFHEKGHLVFNSLESTSRLKLLQQYVFLFWMFFVTVSFFNKYLLVGSGLTLLLYFGIEYYEERWCWNYARKQMQKLGKR